MSLKVTIYIIVINARPLIISIYPTNLLPYSACLNFKFLRVFCGSLAVIVIVNSRFLQRPQNR